MVNSQAISIPKENAADFGRHIMNRPLSLPNGIQKIWLDKVATAALDQSVPMIGGDVARNVLGYNGTGDRKSTRLNSSHVAISYAVFCLKKKKVDVDRT